MPYAEDDGRDNLEGGQAEVWDYGDTQMNQDIARDSTKQIRNRPLIRFNRITDYFFKRLIRL